MMNTARILAIMNESNSGSSMEKRFYDGVYEEGHLSNYGGDQDDTGWQKRISELTDKTRSWLTVCSIANKSSAPVLEVGCGLAYLNGIHPCWHGVEYSKVAVERVKARDGNAVRIYEGDVQQLPFPDDYFEGIYSWAVLEHVPNPHKGFMEIDRVLRGGVRIDGACMELPFMDGTEITTAFLRVVEHLGND